MTDAPGLLENSRTIDALRGELDRTVELAGRIAADQPIATCPDWDAAALFLHLGTIHRWVTTILEQLPQERISRRGIEVNAPADGEWAAWLAVGAEGLSEVAAATDPDEPVWTWGADHHARWWNRRMLHETAVHNADLALALGEGFEIDPLVAADGVCELLDNTAARLTWPGATPPTSNSTVHLHTTNTRDHRGNASEDPAPGQDSLLGELGEWMVTMSDGTVTHVHGHGKGDTAVRGPATEIMLVLNSRLSVAGSGVEVLGDDDALMTLLTATTH